MNKLYSIGIIAFYFSPILLGIIPSVQEKQETPIEIQEVKADEAEPPSITPPVEAPLDLNNKDDLKTFAKRKVIEKWGEGEWNSFDWIVNKESGWRVGVENPKSTAKGLCQLLKTNRTTYGVPDNADAEDELNGCIGYIEARYSTPNNAKEFWVAHGWY